MKKFLKTSLPILLGISIITGCSGKEVSKSSAKEKETVGEQLHYQIVGIDAGSGSMVQTEKVLKEYGLGDKWELLEGSDAAMTAALEKAYKDKKPIIITGWEPHWMFKKFDLKFLKDPQKGFGGKEAIHTLVRKGLKKDHPEAYTFLDRFYWTPSDMESVMMEVINGQTPAKAAEDWVKHNREKVEKWTRGIKPIHGEKLSLAYVAWDTEIASSHVVENILEKDLGYKVDLRQMQTGPMWAGIVSGDNDAMVAAWLPTTDASYYNKYKSLLEDLGPNLEGTIIGLVVPSYMKINSIEDLK